MLLDFVACRDMKFGIMSLSTNQSIIQNFVTKAFTSQKHVLTYLTLTVGKNKHKCLSLKHTTYHTESNIYSAKRFCM